MMGYRADVTAGFIPLIDTAILVAALENGHAAAENLNLTLVRETSWANIRDRLAIGHFEVAHALAPMPIAANLGLTPFDQPIVAPMALGLGGNAVTVSQLLWTEMEAGEAGPAGFAPETAGQLLRTAIERRRAEGRELVRMGVVHPHSAHNLELRFWLAACGVSPDEDIELLILPPAFMADALRAGRIDGYCVGEPWNSVGVHQGHGRILTTKNAIWASSPEKVLAVPLSLVEREEELVNALLKALHAAARWCGRAENRSELARMLSGPDYLRMDAQLIGRALAGPAGYEPFTRAATFPWQSHALWFYSQLVRWGFASHSDDATAKAKNTYRPDIYSRALAEAGAVVPTATSKVEGALTEPQYVGATGGKLLLGPDGFFDGSSFDPDEIDAYISAQKNA